MAAPRSAALGTAADTAAGIVAQLHLSSSHRRGILSATPSSLRGLLHLWEGKECSLGQKLVGDYSTFEPLGAVKI